MNNRICLSLKKKILFKKEKRETKKSNMLHYKSMTSLRNKKRETWGQAYIVHYYCPVDCTTWLWCFQITFIKQTKVIAVKLFSPALLYYSVMGNQVSPVWKDKFNKHPCIMSSIYKSHKYITKLLLLAR